MKLIETLTDLYPEKEWAFQKIGTHQYMLLCDGKATKHRFYDFENMFLPTLTEETKSKMQEENYEGILNRIKEHGVAFYEKTIQSK